MLEVTAKNNLENYVQVLGGQLISLKELLPKRF